MLHEVSRPYNQRELFREWKRWADMLQLVVQRPQERMALDNERYRRHYRRLLAILQREQNCGGLEYRELCRQCEKLLRPWVHVETFQQAERNVLRDVARQAQEATLELMPRATRLVRSLLPVALISFAACVVVLVIMMFGVSAEAGMSGWQAVRLELMRFWQAIDHSFGQIPLGYRLLAGAIAVVGIGIALMRSTRRF